MSTMRRAARPEGNFYILDKSISEDKDLSWAARGLLIYLLGKPDNWEVSVQNLINQTEGARVSSGRDAVRALIRELADSGYVRKFVVHGEGGKFAGYGYEVTEVKSVPETPKPETDKPSPDQPAAANPQLTSTEVLTRTDSEVNTQADKQPKNAKKKPEVHRPDHVSEQVWGDWTQLRKTRKAPVTQTALDGIEREAIKAGYTLEQALEACCSNGWQGFKADWVNKAAKPQAAQPKSFAQIDRERELLRWEEMTGREHEEMRAIRQAEGKVYQGAIIDVTPSQQFLEG